MSLANYTKSELEEELQRREKDALYRRHLELKSFVDKVKENIDAWLIIVDTHGRISCDDDNWQDAGNYYKIRCLRCALLHIKEYGVIDDYFVVAFTSSID